jgi:hypothetical protein
MARVHGREAARARSADEPKEKRLGLIVARVAERDDVGPKVRSRSRKEFVAGRARRVFNRSFFSGGARRDITAIREEGTFETRSQRGAESLVPPGGLAQLMIEMRNAGDRALARLVQFPRDLRERDGI